MAIQYKMYISKQKYTSVTTENIQDANKGKYDVMPLEMKADLFFSLTLSKNNECVCTP
jgi:hypothetical protein